MELDNLERSFEQMKNAAASLDEPAFWAAWRLGKRCLATLHKERDRQDQRPQDLPEEMKAEHIYIHPVFAEILDNIDQIRR